MDCSPLGSSVHGILQAGTLESVPALLQGIFPTQWSNPGLPHCRQILYHLSHKGSPTTATAIAKCLISPQWPPDSSRAATTSHSCKTLTSAWQIVGTYTFARLLSLLSFDISFQNRSERQPEGMGRTWALEEGGPEFQSWCLTHLGDLQLACHWLSLPGPQAPH